MKKFLPLFSAFALVAILALIGCEEEPTQAQSRTQEIVDSMARADSIAILEDSLERVRMMEELKD